MILVFRGTLNASPVRMLRLKDEKLEFITDQDQEPIEGWALGLEDGVCRKLETPKDIPEPDPVASIINELADDDGDEEDLDEFYFCWMEDSEGHSCELRQWDIVAGLLWNREAQDTQDALSRHLTLGLLDYFEKTEIPPNNERIKTIYNNLVSNQAFTWKSIKGLLKNFLIDNPRTTVEQHRELITRLRQVQLLSTFKSIALAPANWAVCTTCDTIDGCCSTELNFIGDVSESYGEEERHLDEEEDYDVDCKICSRCGNVQFQVTGLLTPALPSPKAFTNLFRNGTTTTEEAKLAMERIYDSEVDPASHINHNYVDLMDRQVEAEEIVEDEVPTSYHFGDAFDDTEEEQ